MNRLLPTLTAFLALGILSATANAADLVLYTSQPNEDAQATVNGFMQANPAIKVEWVRDGTPQIMAKLNAEIQAGNPVADVLLIADTVTLERMKQAGQLLAYKAPEAANFDASLYDADGYYYSTKLITTGIVYNTQASMKPESWSDLAKPEAKGLVTMPSPLASGAALIHAQTLAAVPGLGWDFYKQLKANGAVASGGNGGVLKAVASGEKAYGVVVDYMPLREKAKGAPVEFVFPKEGVSAVTEPAAILASTKHADAAKKFIDYLLSQEGQNLAAKLGYIPARKGVALPPGYPAREKINVLPLKASDALKNSEQDAVHDTLTTSLLGSLAALALGGAFAMLITLYDVRWKTALGFLFMLPTMIPPQVTALSWIGMTGPSSTLLKAIGLAPPLGSPQPLYSIGGIALLYGVQNAALVYLSLRASLLALPRDAVEAARLSGASAWQVLKDVILPLSLPGWAAGGAIAFVSCVGNFGIPAILGIPASIYTLTTLIYAKFASFGPGTFGQVSGLSALIAIISVLGLAVQERVLRGRDYRLIGLSGKVAVFKLGRWKPIIELLLWIIIMVMLIMPLIALVASSLAPAYGVPLTPATATIHAYEEIILRQTVTRTAFANSIGLSLATAFGLLAISLLTGYFIARSGGRLAPLISALAEIPYALPGIVLAVAFILVFAAPLPILRVSLYGTLWIILIAYMSSFLAVSLKPVVRSCAMALLILSQLSKSFGPGERPAVRDLSLQVEAGSFLALLGPSGCGKTTVLRMIAGFEQPSGGTIQLGGRLLADAASMVPPEQRNMAMVFQSYALWPHMSVAENVAYPLKVRGVGMEIRRQRVREALAAVRLESHSDRRPADLSGGQRQRVALARCLVTDPAVVLLDEPLANLDRHLRQEMEETFRDFHRRSGATMIYVTHDQAEAMALATEVAVMADGRLLQVASPQDIYARPEGPAVGALIGQGAILQLPWPAEAPRQRGWSHLQPLFTGSGDGPRADVLVRPQDVHLSADGIPATVLSVLFEGERYALKLATADGQTLRALYDVQSKELYQQLEQARAIAETDDNRQLSALAIADADADILCLQEVDNMPALQAFEYGYLYRMVGNGYRQKFLVEGNDTRGIDVAVLAREQTRDGRPIEVLDVRSHAMLTYGDLGLFDSEIGKTNSRHDKIFKRDCLELDLLIGSRPLSLYVVHFKSMGNARDGTDGRTGTMAIRRAEAKAVRHIIEKRFGKNLAGQNFAICGDMNDYQEKLQVIGNRRDGYRFEHRTEEASALDVFTADGFAINPMSRRSPTDRWTLYHARGPQEQHLCQLDYILLSPALAERNRQIPEILRAGQPYRTVFPPGQAVFPVSSVELTIVDGLHPLCLSDADDIRANWQREVSANPALFDGEMVFHRSLRLEGQAISGEAHLVPYSTFLWWRRKADRSGASHLFCYPVLVSADGALIAITMGPHTANPGQVYFAAGSLEPQDIRDGRCDVDSNMRREVLEETGFDLAEHRSDQHYHALSLNRTVALFKRFFIDLPAEEIAARIEAHARAAAEQEIAGAPRLALRRRVGHGAEPFDGGISLPRRYAIYDVFTDKKMSGNPLAVVFQADDLADAAMQAIAREMNLSETVFVRSAASDGHAARLRIFTPARELPFAGHPTVGAAIALSEDEHRADDRDLDVVCVLEEEVGPVRCAVRMRRGEATFAEFDLPRRPVPIEIPLDRQGIADALTVKSTDMAFENHALSVWSAGVPFVLIPLRNLSIVQNLEFEASLWERVAPFVDGALGSAYAYCRGGVHHQAKFHARMFSPDMGISEDPATGAAVAALAGAIHRYDGLPEGHHSLVVEQGVEMGRPSFIHLHIDAKGGEIARARIGGQAVKLAEGTLDL
eukprot:g19963.t1